MMEAYLGLLGLVSTLRRRASRMNEHHGDNIYS